MVRSYRDNDPSWISGKIVKKKGDVTFLVGIEDGIIWKHHVDKLLGKGQSTKLDDTWEYPSHVTFPILVLISHARHLIQTIVQPTLLDVTLNKFIIHQIDNFDNCSHG